LEHWLMEKSGRVAVLTINRPPMNTLSRDTLSELQSLLTEIEDDLDIRVVVITGEGKKMFSAGADITEFGNFADQKSAERSINYMHGIFHAIETFPKPVIASVNGAALGGGNELQMACHLVIASDAAEFGLPEVRLGIIPGYGGTQRLPRLIGKRKALELILSGERISAQTALELGLINKVVSAADLREETLNWANKLGEGPPLAMKGILETVITANEHTLEKGIAIEVKNMLTIARSADAIEGVSAFFSKRKPEFKGK
jgi:enoyl-CoA hydratase